MNAHDGRSMRRVARRGRGRLLDRHRLAGEHRLVALELGHVEQPQVGGHDVADAERDDVAGHEVGDVDRDHVAPSRQTTAVVVDARVQRGDRAFRRGTR